MGVTQMFEIQIFNLGRVHKINGWECSSVTTLSTLIGWKESKAKMTCVGCRAR